MLHAVNNVCITLRYRFITAPVQAVLAFLFTDRDAAITMNSVMR